MGYKTTFSRLRGPVTTRIVNDTGTITVEGDILIDGNLLITGSINNYNISQIATKTEFTSSVGGVTLYNVATPRFVLTGTISSGSSTSITCSLVPNTHFQCITRGTVRNNFLSRSVYTKALNTHVTWFSGSSPIIDFQNTIDDNFYSVNISLSASILNNNLIFTLTSGTGSNYSYTLLGDGSTTTF